MKTCQNDVIFLYRGKSLSGKCFSIFSHYATQTRKFSENITYCFITYFLFGEILHLDTMRICPNASLAKYYMGLQYFLDNTIIIFLNHISGFSRVAYGHGYHDEMYIQTRTVLLIRSRFRPVSDWERTSLQRFLLSLSIGASKRK